MVARGCVGHDIGSEPLSVEVGVAGGWTLDVAPLGRGVVESALARIGAGGGRAFLVRHALSSGFGGRLEVAMDRISALGPVTTFGDVVSTLGSTVVARWIVLRLHGTGDLAIVTPGVLRSASVILAAGAFRAAGAGVDPSGDAARRGRLASLS